MIGLLVQLLISWVIIWLFEKGNLSVLGSRPTLHRITDFILFFFITAGFCASGFLMKMEFGHERWKVNPDLSANLILSGVWWNIKSVLFEELIFRGVILYVFIRKIGAARAILVSAIAFGIYHWFSFGVIGNPMQMGVTFISTATMGLLLAYGYAKTFSLYIPVAIHLGWNLTQIFVFSQGSIGNGLLVRSVPTEFRTNSYLIFFAVTFLPVLLVLLVNYLLIRRHKQVKPAFART